MGNSIPAGFGASHGYEESLEEVALDSMRFCQPSCPRQFDDGGSIELLSFLLAQGLITVDQVSPIRALLDANGICWTLDHRRLYAFLRAGVHFAPGRLINSSSQTAYHELIRKLRAVPQAMMLSSDVALMQKSPEPDPDYGRVARDFSDEVLSLDPLTKHTRHETTSPIPTAFTNEESYFSSFTNHILMELEEQLAQAMNHHRIGQPVPASVLPNRHRGVSKEKYPGYRLAMKFVEASSVRGRVHSMTVSSESRNFQVQPIRANDCVLVDIPATPTTQAIKVFGFIPAVRDTDTSIKLRFSASDEFLKWLDMSSRNSQVFIQPLVNAVSLQRMYIASTIMRRPAFLTNLLDGVVTAVQDEVHPVLTRLYQWTKASFNSSQLTAVQKMTGSEPLVLIHGPPGCGKSTTILAALAWLLAQGKRVLVTSPSNTAVDNIARLCVERGIGPGKVKPDCVLVGAADSIDLTGTLDSIFIDSRITRVKQRISQWADILKQIPPFVSKLRSPPQEAYGQADLQEWIVATWDTILGTLIARLSSVCEDVLLSADFTPTQRISWYPRFRCLLSLLESLHKIASYELNANLSTVNSVDDYKKALTKFPTELEASIEKSASVLVSACAEENSNGNWKDQQMYHIVKDTKLVFATIASSGRPIIMQSGTFDAIIVDEASQSVESESLILTMLDAARLILVGDPYQLSGTVVSLKAKELGYGRSLMGRLMDECKMPSTLLDVQYRMHPDIASFSNISFYGGRVKNDPIVQQPKYNDWKIHALRAFHVEGAEKREGEGGGSIQNLQETYVVVAAVNVLLSSGYKPDQIGVISPYASQARSIKATLRSQKIEVECHTVDAFQGREKDIIIISFVRSNKNQSVGFLQDYQRLNVSITRAKHSLVLIGNLITLASSSSDVLQRFAKHVSSHVVTIGDAIKDEKVLRDTLERCLLKAHPNGIVPVSLALPEATKPVTVTKPTVGSASMAPASTTSSASAPAALSPQSTPTLATPAVDEPSGWRKITTTPSAPKANMGVLGGFGGLVLESSNRPAPKKSGGAPKGWGSVKK